ncbi:hypothetical protein ACRE_057490 [Hapsidospora chrysogenum ATCC 11550]|uniref:DUF7924 domain-containing protein n=1 Tax=Hapsidospora chrysogenum (strain ATCC 11550 / CBS 779.69 / DSM 880 / IAM 14645 / JCM 23072 / IMI 49137) TaxID=857340 RepID=A0A086T287_HAPC1|nr:hypothetical protein ACRE_057490 [Hapsidospora chrysogenum ATCC 11550]
MHVLLPSSPVFLGDCNERLEGLANSTCVNDARRLSHQPRQCNEVTPINSAAFSIAVRGVEARLYISWKHNDLDYYVADVDSFLLHRPEDYLNFRKYVRNILEWGKGSRLREIQDSLDILLEESRKRASAAAKSRAPQSTGSGSSSSSSRGSKSRKTSKQ